jgi:hypothetical protein
MQDHALLQREVYKHETTLAEMDQIFRVGRKRDDVIYDLKKLVENTQKENMQLIKDNDNFKS